MNLGAREKYGIAVVILLIALLLVYIFGIRGSQKRNDELKAQRAELQAQLDYYDALKNENEETEAAIQAVEANISAEEKKFIPAIKTESIEQYILGVFESNGCPYLVSVQSEDIEGDKITMPDGSVAADGLVIKRITVKYSTTDGFNIPQYNLQNSVVIDGIPDEDLFNANIDEMYWHGADSITGYPQFITALKEIEDVAPSCVKINKIATEAGGGYLYMIAEIDFFSATFINRVSEPDMTAPYAHWTGATGVATNAGFIGYPFIVEDPDSAWYMVLMSDDDASTTERPFSTYYSAAIFSDAVEQVGLAAVLDLENAGMARDTGDDEADAADAGADAADATATDTANAA
ncbi:MAG: hypothetical protein J5883_07765 [Clostridiales bacterium]|nr:hypothetical protein [Clostridiales bacterium]